MAKHNGAIENNAAFLPKFEYDECIVQITRKKMNDLLLKLDNLTHIYININGSNKSNAKTEMLN